MTNPSPKGALERLAAYADWTDAQELGPHPYPRWRDCIADLRFALTALSEAEKALGVFLGEDDRFQVAVGGNPNAVEAMIESARTTLSKLRGEK